MNYFFFTLIPFFLIWSSCTIKTNEQKANNSNELTLFTELSYQETNIGFVNIINEDQVRNIFNYEYFYNGGGVGIIDINNDGLQDIFFTGNMTEDRLYLNLGNLKFQDITNTANVGGGNGWSTGVSIADVNNDGLDDIYVSRSGGYSNPLLRKNHLYINNGNNTFSEKSKIYGLDDMGYSTQASFFDYDKDGDLDMYLVNHPTDFNRPMEREYAHSLDSLYTSDKLYKNNGSNKFIEVGKTAKIQNNAFGLGLCIKDLNSDGWPDIYVANDYIEPDYLYLNNKDGTFSESIRNATKHISNYGMGVDIADYNNDGLVDIIVLDMQPEDYKRSRTMMGTMSTEKFWKSINLGYHYQYMRNSLQLNNGNGTFSEIAQLAGVESTDWSWTPLLADFNNDGKKDLFVTNGYKRDVSNRDFVQYTKEAALSQGGQITFNTMEALNMIPSVKLQNYLFKNNGDLTFSNTSTEWGINTKTFSNGAAYADLDNDGDLELVVNNINDYASILKNNTIEQNAGNFLQFTIPSNINDCAKITLIKNKNIQMQEIGSIKGYLSSVSKVIHFGIGNFETIDTLMIEWSDGTINIQKDIVANQTILIQPKKENNSAKKENKQTAIFHEISKKIGLNHIHKENIYDDFIKEPLLPHKQSENGPFMATGDVNADGLDDFFIGGSSGFSGVLYIQKDDGTFRTSMSQPWEKDKICEDMGMLFFDADKDNDLDLYIVSGGNEFENNAKELQDRLYLNNGNGKFTKTNKAIPPMLFSGSCVKTADYDNDGDLDLFIGGRIVSGKYPFAPRSSILNNENGKFTDVTNAFAPDLQYAGMITDAIWQDINNDGSIDLVVVGEWMPITIFENHQGVLVNKTIDYGLDHTNGWWNSIEGDDLDQDGDIDFVVGNLGLNTKFKASKKEPLHIYCADFDENNKLDIVLAQNYGNSCFPIRGRECTSEQMPFISGKYPTFDLFANANIFDIFGMDKLNNSLHLEAKILSSIILINEGENFQIKPLPIRAQFAPINGILIDNFDRNGEKDILLIGNSYAPEVETGRSDAGTGLCLIRTNENILYPLSFKKSGFFTDLNAKSIVSLNTINNQKLILVANNNNRLQAFLYRGI